MIKDFNLGKRNAIHLLKQFQFEPVKINLDQWYRQWSIEKHIVREKVLKTVHKKQLFRVWKCRPF